MTADDVIALACGAYLNDISRSQFTSASMLEIVKASVLELETAMIEAGCPTVETGSSTLALTAVTSVSITSATTPALPSDLILPIMLEERKTGSGDQFVPMVERERLPERDQYETLMDWVWEDESIKLIGATVATSVKIEYQKALGAITLTSSTISPLGSKIFLALRTAQIAALTIGNNSERSAELKVMANTELSKFLVARTKEQQGGYPARRLPYGYIRRQLRQLRQGR